MAKLPEAMAVRVCPEAVCSEGPLEVSQGLSIFALTFNKIIYLNAMGLVCALGNSLSEIAANLVLDRAPGMYADNGYMQDGFAVFLRHAAVPSAKDRAEAGAGASASAGARARGIFQAAQSEAELNTEEFAGFFGGSRSTTAGITASCFWHICS